MSTLLQNQQRLLDNLEQQYSQLEQDKKQLQNKIKDLAQQIAQDQQVINQHDFSGQLSLLKQQQQQLEQDLQLATSEFTSLTSNYNNLIQQSDTMIKQLNMLSSGNCALEQAKTNLAKQITDLESLINQQQSIVNKYNPQQEQQLQQQVTQNQDKIAKVKQIKRKIIFTNVHLFFQHLCYLNKINQSVRWLISCIVFLIAVVVLFFNSNFQYDSGKNLANIWPSLSNSFLLSSSAQQNQNAINLYATTPEHCLELTKTFTQQNNLTSAQEWLLKAIESNYAPAEYYLYQQLVADANYAPSLSESSPEYWLLKAAQDGDIDAQHEYAKQDLKRLLEVASWYQEGKFGEEKVSQAKEWNDLIVKQAKSPEDYFQLAKELAQQNNLESSEFWLLKSLGNSYAPAEYYVYQQLVTNANYAPSLSERSPEYWLLEAAQGGDIDAQHEYAKQDPKRLLDIASWYQQGKFGEEQTNQAKSWIDLASQYAKTPEIFLQLAKIYANYSPESSQLWLLKAVAQDYPPAEYYLSQQLFTHAFANLDKIPQNKTSSNYWLLKAAQGGDIDAQHEYAKQDPKRLREVASWYQQGKFGKAKINQAQEWLQLASQYTPQVKDSSDNSEQQLTDDNKSWYDSIKDWFIKVFDWIKNLFKWVIFIAGVILAIVIVVGIFAESGELGCIGVSIVIFIAMFLVSALFNWLFDKPSVKPEPLPIRQSSKFHEHKKHSKVISATEADKITDPLVAISNIQQKYQDWTSNQLSDSKFNHYLDQQYNRYTKLLTYVYTNLFNGCSDSSQLVASERQWFKFKQAKISNSNYTPLQQKTIKVLLETQRAHVLQQMKNCTDSDGLSSANNYEQDTQNLINF